MAVYTTTSSKSLIAKAKRDFNLQGTNWIYDAYEWIGECLRAIGHSAGFETKELDINVSNYRFANYPCDFESILGIEFNGVKLEKLQDIRKSPTKALRKLGGSVYGGSFTLATLDNNGGTEEGETIVPSISNTQGYWNNLSYLQFTFEEGTATMYYKAIPTDEDGFPMVPDTYAHREAIIYYILFKYLSRGNTHPVWDIKSANEQFRLYRSQAANKGKFPSIDDMISFEKMWVRHVIDKTAMDRFFGGLEDRQSIENI